MSRRHLALLVPDGVGVRNFVHTSFLEIALGAGPVTLWHALPDALARAVPAGIETVRLPPHREGAAERVLRQAKIYAQLYGDLDRARHRDGAAAALAFRQPPRRRRDRAVGGLARLLGRAMPGAVGAARLHRLHARAASGATATLEAARQLGAIGADIVFCTHQRASQAVPAMLAARRLGVPAATFVYSWDNLPKGRMAVHADDFLVWSEAMARQLLGYHPEVREDHVHVAGTPQFEPYFRAAGRSREAFLADHGLDAARPVVCFSGDDRATSPLDPLYLRDLARALAALPSPARPQILFRPCPADDVERYREVLAAHPEIAVSLPAWRRGAGDWTQMLPTPEDLVLLAEVVRACDVVVNLGSTMALDFAIHEKPAVFVAYEPEGATAPGWSAATIYRLPHFVPVHRLDPVHWARSAGALGGAVADALARPDEKAAARRRWLEETVATPLAEASRRIDAALTHIARRAA